MLYSADLDSDGVVDLILDTGDQLRTYQGRWIMMMMVMMMMMRRSRRRRMVLVVVMMATPTTILIGNGDEDGRHDDGDGVSRRQMRVLVGGVLQ
jgi:hypothetical protein